jgi:hypothetical protein
MGGQSFPCVISLWPCHIRQMVIIVVARCISHRSCNRCSNHSLPVFFSMLSGGNSHYSLIANHRLLACGHQIKIWKVSSASMLQIWHTSVVAIPLLNILLCVAIALEHIFEVRVFILGGTGQFQITLQHGLVPVDRVLVAPLLCRIIWSSRPNLYADLTENMPR